MVQHNAEELKQMAQYIQKATLGIDKIRWLTVNEKFQERRSCDTFGKMCWK